MHQQTFTVDFGYAGKVTIAVESEQELSLYHSLGAMETACGELIRENNALMNSDVEP